MPDTLGTPVYDMHCHLGFSSNALQAAAEMEACGAAAFAVSVLPSENWTFAQRASSAHSRAPGMQQARVRWGIGLHPWWVADGRAGERELDELLAAMEDYLYIGEVGLDFGKTHGQEAERQTAFFSAIAQRAAQLGGRVLSIHAVRAGSEVLRILLQSGTFDTCTCIFHWYSDSAEVLTQALRAGAFVSVGLPMLQTKRGREYARQIPPKRLLLETDQPAEGQPYEVSAMQEQLKQTCAHIATLRGRAAGELHERIRQNSMDLLR